MRKEPAWTTSATKFWDSLPKIHFLTSTTSPTSCWDCTTSHMCRNIRRSHAFGKMKRSKANFQLASSHPSFLSHQYHSENFPQETGKFHWNQQFLPDFQHCFRRKQVCGYQLRLVFDNVTSYKNCMPHSVGKEFFEVQTIATGISQGSFLSPILINVLSADIPSQPRVMTSLYADNIALIRFDNVMTLVIVAIIDFGQLLGATFDRGRKILKTLIL